MATGKRGAPAPRPRSGANVEDWQRGTERITLRLSPGAMELLRNLASERGWTLADTVAYALETLDALDTVMPQSSEGT